VKVSRIFVKRIQEGQTFRFFQFDKDDKEVGCFVIGVVGGIGIGLLRPLRTNGTEAPQGGRNMGNSGGQGGFPFHLL
jgi:hypothetical protein